MRNRVQQRIRRHKRIRKKIFGTPERPRLCVFRSARHIYAQVIDDVRGHTLASACSLVNDLPAVEEDLPAKQRVAKAVGKLIARKAKELGISRVVFDRGGYRYHGRVAALADGAREGGLEF